MSKNYDLMCDHFWSLNSINLFIEHNQNFTSFGSLALILWFPYTHAKDISNKIHSIISCPQTISLSIFCNVGRSMYLTCVHVKIQNALTKSYTHQIMKYNKKIHLKMTFFMQMEAFHNLFYKKIGVEILVKYRNLVESTFETQIFSRLSQHFCLIFFHPKKY